MKGLPVGSTPDNVGDHVNPGFGARRVFALASLLAVLAVVIAWQSRASSPAAAVRLRPERHPQTSWAPCNSNAHNTQVSTFHPLSDGRAAKLITREPETRPDNDRSFSVNGVRYSAPNAYVPTHSQVLAFQRAKSSAGQTNISFNPYYKYVDGRDHIRHASTDDLIQWAAHKWGIPENWLRAEYVRESYWNQFMLGDDTPVSATWYRRYPSQSRVADSSGVYQSLGITQVRWAPDGSLHPGTEPLRWKSTPFNVDYQAATLRFYYDNPQGTRTAWNDPSYRPCQEWNSVGGWFSPYPWNNAGQHSYVHSVQQILTDRTWTSSDFLSWTPASLPPGVSLLHK